MTELERVTAERDRLRAVVDAARRWRQAKDDAPSYLTTREELALDELYEELDALDVSSDTGSSDD